MSEDAHDSNNSSNETGNIFPACTPSQDQALRKLRDCTNTMYSGNLINDLEEMVARADSGIVKIPVEILENWAKIDAEKKELERLYEL